LDNASANDVLQNSLKSQLILQSGLIYGGNSFMFVVVHTFWIWLFKNV